MIDSTPESDPGRASDHRRRTFAGCPARTPRNFRSVTRPADNAVSKTATAVSSSAQRATDRRQPATVTLQTSVDGSVGSQCRTCGSGTPVGPALACEEYCRCSRWSEPPHSPYDFAADTQESRQRASTADTAAGGAPGTA